jgi:sugar O-acyltransferase (sialic acid O-acetyltransferase NeuD family)
MILTNKTLHIIGAGGHGHVIADMATLDVYSSIYFIDDNLLLSPLWPIVSTIEHYFNQPSETIDNIIVGIGDTNLRMRHINAILSNTNHQLVNIIHPSAIISEHISLGQGIVMMASTVINIRTVLGNGVIINTRSSIDHDCIIQSGVHICPGVTIGGHVFIGENTWIGIGSTIKNNIYIGKNVMIGAGSLVLHDIPDNQIVYGHPAKCQRGSHA